MMWVQAGGEHVGTFWHPARPDERMPGVLRVSERGDPSLQLFGWIAEALDGREAVRLAALLGEVGGEQVSLWDCSLSHAEGDPRDRLDRGQPCQTFEGHQLLVAERHYPDPDEACFASVSLRVTHLEEWAAGMLSRRNEDAHYDVTARVRGARIQVWGRTIPFGERDRFGHTTQHGVTLTLTEGRRLSLQEMWFQWERPFLSYLTQAVGDQVHVTSQYASCPGERLGTEVFTRGGRPGEEPDRIFSWSMLMCLSDGLFETRMRRWYALDDACAHGLTNLQMVHARNNSWTNNKLMNVAAAFDNIGAELTSLPKEVEAIAHRNQVAALIQDPALRRWFHDATQFAGRPSYAAMLTALHAPVADATYPLVKDGAAWVQALVGSRNGLAHALEKHFTRAGDFRHDYALAGVSHAVLMCRLMLELGYSITQIRKRVVEMPEMRHWAEQWWQVMRAPSHVASGATRARPTARG